jgi:hypothetical protein
MKNEYQALIGSKKKDRAGTNFVAIYFHLFVK